MLPYNLIHISNELKDVFKENKTVNQCQYNLENLHTNYYLIMKYIPYYRHNQELDQLKYYPPNILFQYCKSQLGLDLLVDYVKVSKYSY